MAVPLDAGPAEFRAVPGGMTFTSLLLQTEGNFDAMAAARPWAVDPAAASGDSGVAPERGNSRKILCIGG